MRAAAATLPLVSLVLAGSCKWVGDRAPDLMSCGAEIASGARPIADSRTARFQGKVQEATAKCRGGSNAVAYRDVPWTDWGNYWAASDEASKSFWPTKNLRGVNGSLIDLEYARVELIKFNLFDNSGTYRRYIGGDAGADGSTIKTWPEMRLPPSHSSYAAVGGAAAEQHCTGELIRFRTLNGICNDMRNPLMGASGTLFARNVQFESTFPDKGLDQLARNRHGDRLSLVSPDPQVISRRLFTRAQSDSAACDNGYGKPGYSKDANCDYKKAPFFNVLAAFWIQFMTHDWFTHLEEGHNAPQYMAVGCATKRVNGADVPLTPADVAKLGCRPADQMDRSYVADSASAPTFAAGGVQHMSRAPRVFRNNNTAWWDASMIYGYDDLSGKRVKRDPKDSAKLLMLVAPGAIAGDAQGLLPILAASDPQLPDWAGQESAGFPDNWTIGMSFYHNVFAREHNQFVDAFRSFAAQHPDEDSGVRDPAKPRTVIRYRDVSANELFELGRLVIAAEIAKIHTIEWTPQLLYDEPLYRGMNANWYGLVRDTSLKVLLANVVNRLASANKGSVANSWYSVLASGPGIIGLGAQKANWSVANEEDVNGGTNHFGSPFNFPEEFVSVYRLHPLVPDLLEYRQVGTPNAVAAKIPVVETFRGRATGFMHDRGLSNWALTMGRQRLGVLSLQNSPRFLQNIRIDRLHSPTKQIDVAALDIIRDRERGVPRFNEFRRQYGLRTLTSFDDFIDHHLAKDTPDYAEQQKLVSTLREVYGQHRCDASKVITRTQLTAAGDSINDCLDHADGTMVDNVEDLDTVVGWLAETTRPHGFAISETQFVVFILNASRRLYSDRFFTSSFRPEIYSTLGYNWVNNNGPEPKLEPHPVNGHDNQPVSPFKRILLRAMPELATELGPVENVFDPWARNRGTYYSVAWTPRAGAESDEAFSQPLGVTSPVDLSPVSLATIAITIAYAILLLWGVSVGVRQVYQGFNKPAQLLNPLFGNRQAITIFTFHLIIVSLDLFVCGPLSLHFKDRTWYWGGRIALLTSSLPLAFYFNRNPQSFGKLIGTWVRFRNIFEISLHVLVAAIALNWFYYYGLLYWLVAYRYLDVGPRRLMQTFYNTPEKLKARPWLPALNWGVITSIYVLAALAIYNRQVIFAAPPNPARPDHIAGPLEVGLVVALNVALAMIVWGMVRKYTGEGPAAELLPRDESQPAVAPADAYPTPARVETRTTP